MTKSLISYFLASFGVVLCLNTICIGKDLLGQENFWQSKEFSLNKEETRLLESLTRNHENHSKTNSSNEQFYKTVSTLYISYRSQIKETLKYYDQVSHQKPLPSGHGPAVEKARSFEAGCRMGSWMQFSDNRDQAKKTRAQLRKELSEISVTKIDNYLGMSPTIFNLHGP